MARPRRELLGGTRPAAYDLVPSHSILAASRCLLPVAMPPSPHATSAHSASLVSRESRSALLAWFHAARAKRMMPWRRLPPDGQSRVEYRKRLAEDGRLGQWAYEVRSLLVIAEMN